MNDLDEYGNIDFSMEYYKSLQDKDIRIIIKQLDSVVEQYKIDNVLDCNAFTLCYYTMKLLNRNEILQFIQSFILSNMGSSHQIDFLLLKFLQESCTYKKSDELLVVQRIGIHQLKHLMNNHTKMCLETSLKLIEYKFKDADLRQLLLNVVLSQLDNNTQFIKNRLVQMIYGIEDIEGAVVDILYQANHGVFSTNMLTTLAEHALNTSTHETNALKYVNKLLTLASQRLPKIFNQNLQVFMQFYDHENYILRSTINQIITNIIIQLLNPTKQELDIERMEHNDKQRLHLIDILYSRIYDKNAHGRVNTLKMITLLCSSNLIPIQCLLGMFVGICGRIQDASSQVRKAALTLVKTIVKFLKTIFVDGLSATRFLTQVEIFEQLECLQLQVQQCRNALDEVQYEKSHAQDENAFNTLDEEEKLIVMNLKDKIKQQTIFKQYSEFTAEIQSTIPNILLLLSSKAITDVQKAISLVSFLFKQQIENSEKGVMKMLMLISNPLIISKVANKFYQIFFNVDTFGELTVIGNIVHLFTVCNKKELIQLEQLIIYLMKDRLDNQLLEQMWLNFIKLFTICDQKYVIYGEIMRIVITNRKQLLNDFKVEQLAKIINYQKKEVNWQLVISISQLISRVANITIIGQFFQQLIQILFLNFGSSNPLWFAAAQEVLSLSRLIQQPEKTFEYIIKMMIQKLFNRRELNTTQTFLDDDMELTYTDSSWQMAQLLFIVGHSALQMIVHIDNLKSSLQKHPTVESETDELDKIQGGQEAEFDENADYLHRLIEEKSVHAQFLATFTTLALDILTPLLDNTQQPKQTVVESMAALTLCKFMCLSEQYCNDHVELVFKLLEMKHINSSIKNNLVVAIGDLLHRFPNTLAQHSRLLFRTLHHSEYVVRRTTLSVLTHLVLNDMLKIKREIGDVGLLLSDPDDNIQQLARLFFYQLHRKDSKLIQNALPDIINQFSNEESEEQFQVFINNIGKYIDRNIDHVVDKLLRRMKDDINDAECRNISYTLAQLQVRESFAKRLYDCFPYYKDRLKCPIVKDNFANILRKLHKLNLSQDNRAILEEYEGILNNGVETKRRVVSSKSKILNSQLLDSALSQSTQD